MQHFLDRILSKVRLIFPFSYVRMVKRSLDKKGSSILDVGCGPGEAMKVFNPKRKFYTVGIDAYSPQLKQCQSTNSHDSLIFGDIRFLPFKEGVQKLRAFCPRWGITPT
ncbi:hypothetical protein HKBW3S44_01397 [Candidatus Hakubella thermalkaliphila]|uniref:Methyltransferase type 11 domain-containing protein n=2 Tax=Candidatus Hakubella thermalkaliphila TaxID=2754717 RepID=A0A6V8PZR0_9ACTN